MGYHSLCSSPAPRSTRTNGCRSSKGKTLGCTFCSSSLSFFPFPHIIHVGESKFPPEDRKYLNFMQRRCSRGSLSSGLMLKPSLSLAAIVHPASVESQPMSTLPSSAIESHIWILKFPPCSLSPQSDNRGKREGRPQDHPSEDICQGHGQLCIREHLLSFLCDICRF